MRFRAHPWFLVAGLTALCAAAIWGLMTYRNRNEWDSAKMARSLPHDNAIIAYANVSAIRSSGLLQTIFGSKSVEELDYRRFVDESGFDYKSDLDRVAISFQRNSRYAIAVGRFDWPKIKNYALRSGAECVNAVCEVKGKALENSTSFYPLHGSALALASTPNPGGAYTIAHPDFPFSPDDRTSATAPVWVSVPGRVFRDQSILPTGAKIFGSALGAAEHALFTIEPDSNGKQYKLGMRVTCSNEQDARNILKQLEEATSLLRKMIERDNLKPKPSDLAALLVNGKFALESPLKLTGEWPLELALVHSIAEGNVE
jgi:hypothetical protein